MDKKREYGSDDETYTRDAGPEINIAEYQRLFKKKNQYYLLRRTRTLNI
jgi:hypothetical protein